jgi:hypothetical protein
MSIQPLESCSRALRCTLGLEPSRLWLDPAKKAEKKITPNMVAMAR